MKCLENGPRPALVVDLGATHDRHQGPLGAGQHLREGLQLLLDQQARHLPALSGRHSLRRLLGELAAHHRRVRPVCRAEGVVHVDVALEDTILKRRRGAEPLRPRFYVMICSYLMRFQSNSTDFT